jgi:hypothetical protein
VTLRPTIAGNKKAPLSKARTVPLAVCDFHVMVHRNALLMVVLRGETDRCFLAMEYTNSLWD